MTKLKPYQLDGARRIHEFGGRALLCDDMGLGKTLQTLYWLFKTPRRRPVVIVCPASLKWTWQAEAALHLNMRTEVLEGNANGRRVLPGDIVILNYDILKSWLPALLRARPQCVVFDEVHYVKSLQAQRTRAAIKLVSNVPAVIGISGTPLTNRPIELWSVMKLIRPDVFPSREVYAWTFCKPRHTIWGWKYDGAAKLPKLHRILRETCMIRRLKSEVLPELPDKQRKVISFKLTSYAEYHKAETDFLGWLRELSPARANRAKRSQALTKVGYLFRLAARLKLEWTTRWIADFLESYPGEKLVALTMHTFVIDHLKARFPRSVVVDGRVVGRKRDETVRKFQSNKQVDLFLGNWKAAGQGITLHAAHNFAALDFPWTPGDMLQGEDRIHRIGQKKLCLVHYLMALGTIEEKWVRILRRKAGVLDAILNGRGRSTDLDIFDELLKELRGKH